ncbi:MAG: helix-turn-helix transcriptional regulator [Alphaproteobacteria bacterium]|nr:helix-turn-helix transcriptional regulator [Alphaproteobacteria bacterium]
MPRGRKKMNSEIQSDDMVIESGLGPVDAYVGSRICARRRLLQLSQKQMAERLGVTFQQVQKYEKGVNRIGAGRLYSIAKILGVSISYFFEEVEVDAFLQYPEYSRNNSYGFFMEDDTDLEYDPMRGSEATMLVRAYYRLPPKSRKGLLQMLNGLRNTKEDLDDEI